MHRMMKYGDLQALADFSNAQMILSFAFWTAEDFLETRIFLRGPRRGLTVLDDFFLSRPAPTKSLPVSCMYNPE